LRGIEERKGTEDALRRSAAELEQKNRELRQAHDATFEAIELKSRFLANLSHEIRTPMNAVIGMTQVLAETKLDAEQHDYLGILERSAHSLMQLLDDILDLSKFESGHLEMQSKEFSVREVLVDVDALLRARAESKGLRFRIEIGDDVSPTQVGDPDRLRQILLNLVSNALKFTEEGEVKVVASLVARHDRLRIEIHDSGIGIEPAQKDRVFESFTQADGSATRRHGGAGLGLSIVRRLVERMGGEVGVESERGRGSVFWVEIPEMQAPVSVEPVLV
jgi:signal transduction histidine kinase